MIPTPNSSMIEDQYAKVWIEDNIVYSEYKHDRIDLEAAKAWVALRLKVVNGKTYPILIDMRNLKSATKEARDYLANGDATSYVAAAALLANSFVTKMMVNFFLTFNKPKVPIQMFNDKNDALRWLGKFSNQ